jgi:hypothetical protein
MRLVRLITAAGALALVAPGAHAAHAATSVHGGRMLSDERTFTRWAHPLHRAPVRTRPSSSAPRIGRLRTVTEDGEPDVSLLLSERRDARGVRWMRLRLAGRPNGRTGWVPAAALGPVHLTRWSLVIDRARLRATLRYAGQRRWSAPVGVGAPSSPTPPGRFWIRELFRVPSGTIYGPFAFGTSDYSTLSDWPRGGIVGIHGTDTPSLVPGRPSHGCVRLRNADIVYLAHRLPVGAPVAIR